MTDSRSLTPYELGRQAYYTEQSDGCPLDGVQRSEWRRGYNDARRHWEDDTTTDARNGAASVLSRVSGARPSNYRGPAK